VATNYDVDTDILRGVLALWDSLDALKATPLKHPPRTGRLVAPDTLPNVHLASEFSKDERGVGYRKDRRKVTITIRGLHDDVSVILARTLNIFNASLGLPGFSTLIFPSGAKFIKWWPLNSGTLAKQEEAEKDGQDVWIGVIEAEVTTARAE
jgi:hypothetical protein